MTLATPAPRRVKKKIDPSRRVNLSKDILDLLAVEPNLPIGTIVAKTGGKRNSIKSVIWKLIQQERIECVGVADAVCSTGPKQVNVYSLREKA